MRVSVVCSKIIYLKLNSHLVAWFVHSSTHGPHSIQLYMLRTDMRSRAGSRWEISIIKTKTSRRNRLCFIYFNNCSCSYVSASGFERCWWAGCCGCCWRWSWCVHDFEFGFFFSLPLREENMHKILPQSLGNLMAKLIHVIWYALLKMAAMVHGGAT